MWMWTIAARNHLFFNRSFNPGLTTYSEKPIFKLANKSFGSDSSFSLFAAKDLESKNMRWVREQRFNLIFKRTGLAIITITIVTCYKLCAMYATINTCKVYSALNKRCLTLAGKKTKIPRKATYVKTPTSLTVGNDIQRQHDDTGRIAAAGNQVPSGFISGSLTLLISTQNKYTIKPHFVTRNGERLIV